MGNILAYILAEYLNEITKKPQRPKQITTRQLRLKAQQELGINVDTNYNFAICGRTGTGKSSIINGVRKLRDFEPNSAKTGEEETTMDITPYPYPGYSHIVLWDIPGGGTFNHFSDNYFEDKKLYAFDCLLVVTSNRFCELDVHIAREAVRFRTPVVFVRNKADQDIMAKVRRRLTEQQAKVELRTEVESKCRPQLSEAGSPSAQLFIVSSWAFTDQAVVQMDEVALINYVVSVAVDRRKAN